MTFEGVKGFAHACPNMHASIRVVSRRELRLKALLSVSLRRVVLRVDTSCACVQSSVAVLRLGKEARVRGVAVVQ